MNQTVRFLLMSIVIFGMVACGDEPVEVAPQATAKKVRPTQPVVAQKADEIREESKPVFSYSPIGQRDPFESLLRKEKETAETETPKTPLEKYDLGQFRVQAILVGKGAPRAMVSAPDGKNYILKPGLKIGKNSGVVKDITKTAIIVEESTFDYLGNKIKGIQSITIPEQESL